MSQCRFVIYSSRTKNKEVHPSEKAKSESKSVKNLRSMICKGSAILNILGQHCYSLKKEWEVVS